jgi:hypothetical protein
VIKVNFKKSNVKYLSTEIVSTNTEMRKMDMGENKHGESDSIVLSSLPALLCPSTRSTICATKLRAYLKMSNIFRTYNLIYLLFVKFED